MVAAAKVDDARPGTAKKGLGAGGAPVRALLAAARSMNVAFSDSVIAGLGRACDPVPIVEETSAAAL